MLLPLLVAAALWTAPPSSPAPGEYVLEGGNGTLTITRVAKALSFKLEVIGANAHVCELEGTVTGDLGQVHSDACAVQLKVKGDAVEVAAKDAEACRSWCGARAWFGGRYLMPTPSCAAAQVKASRGAFKRHSAAHAFAEAKADLTPLLERCEPVLSRFDLWWIRNDLAITLHHLGDDAGCRSVLEPMTQLARTPDDELGGAEPAFEDLYRKVAKATRANLKACEKK
jgi:hypothetical protein